ncbi:zinc finger protein 260-like [Diorhabda carinulata]|uniref:zinc finger protein 260-like n=1 Tax=Diorhabda carinulata TaxID=1163345 RepID=UPI00259FF0B5|nr:zinc finger protein 260-like [Diorhabda carinulata]
MFEIEVINEEQKNVITFAAEEVDTICRSCLNKDATINLFESSYKGTLLCEIFHSLFAQLNQRDSLPRNICDKCVDMLTQFCAFKEQIIQSQTLLELFFGDPTKVDESINKNNVKFNEEKYAFDKYSDDIYDVDEMEVLEVNNSHNKAVAPYKVHKEEKDDVKEEVVYDPDFESVFLKEVIVEHNEITDEPEIKLEVKEYMCSFCGEKFYDVSKYRRHRQMEIFRRRAKKICHICSKEVLSCKLPEHLNSHAEKKPYPCDSCSMKFSRKENLARHQYTHTEVKPHMCHICGKGFIQELAFNNHLRKHNDIAPLVSQYCGRKFTNKQAFERHLKLHEKNPEMRCKERKCTQKYVYSKYICEYCEKEFKNKQILDIHIRSHTGETPYVCSMCDKGFTTKQMLDFHIRRHTGDRPFVCSICGSKFIQNAHLKTHLHLHKGEKPYSCTYCDKKFALKGNLGQHIKTHTGDRPYVCNLCGKGFCTGSSLRKHKTIHNKK